MGSANETIVRLAERTRRPRLPEGDGVFSAMATSMESRIGEVVIHDLSERGLAIRVQTKLELGQTFVGTVRVGTDNLYVRVKVRHQQPSGFSWLVGLEITWMQPEGWRRLAAIVARYPGDG